MRSAGGSRKRLVRKSSLGRGEAPEDAEDQTIELDATLTFSEKEILQAKDFEDMSAEEIERAKRVIQTMRLPIMAVPTRRFFRTRTETASTFGKPFATACEAAGPASILPVRSGKKGIRRWWCWPTSRARWTAIRACWCISCTRSPMIGTGCSAFVFGTRLTNITRQLRYRDVDIALSKVGQMVEDWSGGTRIGHCLDDFNRNWSRRVLGQGAVVLLITDGLDRDAGEGLDAAMERLQKSCRRLIWLNPLMRFDGYAPTATGARAIVKHVDDFRTVHNLASLEDLGSALAA